MTIYSRVVAGSLLALACGALQSRAVELKVGRDVLERTLKQQLFGSASGRYYLKGSPQTPCSVYVEDPQLHFADGRIVVLLKTHAWLSTAVRGMCLGIALSPTAEVSVAPDGEGESIGFRDARVEHISDQRELNFVLTPFLSHKIPSGMKVNAADLLRNALAGSTATSGYKVTLDQLKIRSMQIENDALVVEADGSLSVK